MKFVCYNGNIISDNELLFNAQNRSFRYGDGVFETIKVLQNNIVLADYHFDRLFTSLRLLQIQTNKNFNSDELSKYILEVCSLNKCSNLARVRLAVFRNNDNKAEFVIEAVPLPVEAAELNNKGFTIGLYPFAKKQCDAFANLKTANYLPYVMSEIYARERGWDQSIILNSQNKISDASKANVFLIMKGEIYTPALHQGCINGVMRRYIIEKSKESGYIINQTEIEENMLLNADEIFLTNAILGIRWVQQFRNVMYKKQKTGLIYDEIVKNTFTAYN